MDANALLRGPRGGGKGVVFMVLAVGNEHDGAAALVVVRRLGEGEQRLRQRPAHGRTLHRHQRGVDAACESPRHAVIRRHGQLHAGFAREDHQTDALLAEPFDEAVDGILRTLQTAGLEILGQHRVRDIDHQHQLHAFGFLLAEFRAGLRTRGGECQQPHGTDEEQEFEPQAPRSRFGREVAQQCGRGETRHAAPSEPQRQPAQRHERRHGRKQPQEVRIGESEHDLRNFSENEMRQQELRREQHEGGQHPPHELLVVEGELGNFHLALFEAVDLLVDGLKLRLVRGAEVAAPVASAISRRVFSSIFTSAMR